MTLVLGVDAGGTASRASLMTVSGAVVGRGGAAGGNPMALGAEAAFANIGGAVREALARADPTGIKAGTIALAGVGMLRDPMVRRAFEEAMAGAGLAEPPRVVGDVVAAFAAGTAEPSGTVLIAGTGAIAAKITDYRQLDLADGYGWQLGDEGSAFWLGRQAARTAIRQATSIRQAPPEGRAPSTRQAISGAGCMTELVIGQLLPGEVTATGRDLADLLATAVQSRPPLALAELAPLVGRAAEEGDPAALAVIADAAARLAHTASEVRAPGDRTPIVLAGGALTGPLRHTVADRLARLWDHATITTAGDGAGAAAWLALRDLLPADEARLLHTRFTTPRPVHGT